MAFDNTNRWTLNRNTDKQQDTHSDYKGKINVDGVDYWLNGWIKDGPNGKFISGTIKRVEQQQPRAEQPRAEPRSISQQALAKVFPHDRITSGPQKNDLNDDIPF